MGKMTEFYKKVLADKTAKNELSTILGRQSIENASDEQLLKIEALAKKLDVEITIEEAKAFFKGDNKEIDDSELDAVAGGGKHDDSIIHFIYCEIGGSAEANK